MYKGKEVCQGCNLTGEANPRPDKNQLCRYCTGLLNVGKTVNHESLIEYTMLRDWVNGLPTIDGEEFSLNNLANELLKGFDCKTAKPTYHEDTIRAQHLGSMHYRVPSFIVEPFNKFLISMRTELLRIKDIEKEAERKARNAVSVERNKIFNEGVEKGRELLFSLNNGAITMEDFNKKITKY